MSGGLIGSPLVSVIISNYNYGRFLREAVDSALNQTYSNVEVIVVDDGSTDNSREIIASYGDQIIPLLKENGGQLDACSVGFLLVNGEIVIFFDSDDVLLPDTVQKVVELFRAKPNIVRVQYRLEGIDKHGNPTGELIPPGHVTMLSGDLRQHTKTFYHHTWPPTSGNALASNALRQLLPC